MRRQPWIRPVTTFLSEPIVMRASRKAYWHWAAGLIIALPITWWFYWLYMYVPADPQAQIALSLMIGLDVWLVARVLSLLVCRLSIDLTGLRYRSLFQEVALGWDELARIEWWHTIPAHTHYYRLCMNDGKPLATFGDDTWSRLNEGIGYAVARTRLEPTPTVPRVSELNRVLLLILMPLAVTLFALVPFTITRAIGFVLVRIFWTALVWHYSRYELRTAQFYLALTSLAAILTLMRLSGSSFEATLIWWLYSPLIEVVVSLFVVELPRLLRKVGKHSLST